MAADHGLDPMKAELTVREAHAGDADLLHNLLCRAFGEYEGRLDPPSGVHLETSSSLAERLRRGGALVCEAGTAAVGCAFYEPGAGFLYVGRFGVVPERRGTGIGALLLEAAERHAPGYGFTTVRLNVRIALEGLRAYYEARGYAPIAYHAHVGYASPTYVEMEKELS
jgi:GNAT superfamily N-acetyltransferase